MFVGMCEFFEFEDWVDVCIEFLIVFGKDVFGKLFVFDFMKMFYLFIVGVIGLGKFVCINFIVVFIFYFKSFKDVCLLMVDLKIVELKIFNIFLYMFIFVVIELKKVFVVFKWFFVEMEQCYQIFVKVGVCNIIGFNVCKKVVEFEVFFVKI